MLICWTKACLTSKPSKPNETTRFISYRQKQKQVWDLKLITPTWITYLARANSIDWPFPGELGDIMDNHPRDHSEKFNLTLAEFCSLTIPQLQQISNYPRSVEEKVLVRTWKPRSKTTDNTELSFIHLTGSLHLITVRLHKSVMNLVLKKMFKKWLEL